MKASLISFVLLCLFIVITTAAADTSVRDITGKVYVRNNGGKYHIVPIQGGRSITLTKKTCPSHVVLGTSVDNKQGDGFIFSHYTRDAILHESRSLSIDSGKPVSGCNKSTTWTIMDAEAKAPLNLIATGGDDGKCFQVVKYPRAISSKKMNTYMLQYCPSFCGGGSKACYNISIYSHKGVTHLASSGGSPFEFGFQKVQVSK